MAHTSSATKWEVRSPLRKGRYPCGSPGGGDCAPQAWARSAGSWPQDSGLADHRALPQELACPILMVIKTARGSDTAKVTRPESGRTGLNSAPTSRTASCRCAAGPPAPPVFSPQQSGGKAGRRWETGDLSSFRGRPGAGILCSRLSGSRAWAIEVLPWPSHVTSLVWFSHLYHGGREDELYDLFDCSHSGVPPPEDTTWRLAAL